MHGNASHCIGLAEYNECQWWCIVHNNHRCHESDIYIHMYVMKNEYCSLFFPSIFAYKQHASAHKSHKKKHQQQTRDNLWGFKCALSIGFCNSKHRCSQYTSKTQKTIGFCVVINFIKKNYSNYLLQKFQITHFMERFIAFVVASI